MTPNVPQLRRANPNYAEQTHPVAGSAANGRMHRTHGGYRRQRTNGTTLPPPQIPPPQQKSLSPREVQVLNLIAAGKTHAAIASELGVREHTVLTHIRNLRVKLGAKNKLDAVLTGIRSGIVTE